MSQLAAWFNARSLRERRLLLAMLALAAVTVVWGLVIIPVRNGLSSSRARYAAAVVRLGEAEAQLRSVKSIQRRQLGPVPLPLADAVRERAAAAGLSLGSVDPQGDGQLRIIIPTARAGAVLTWVAGLEREGILVNELSLTSGAPGTVSASMMLRARQA